MNHSREILKDYMPLADNCNKRVHTPFRGVLYENLNDELGRPVLRKLSDNTVVLGGAISALEYLSGVQATFKPGTLNQILEINESAEDKSGKNPRILLFGLGNGGATLNFGSINEKNIKLRNIPNMIPLRVCEGITGTDADKYYMKKANADGTTYKWYLKEFSDVGVIKSLWKDSADDSVDGTEIVAEVYDSEREEGIESFLELKIDLNIKDGREYYESIGELDIARYNTLGIYTGNKVLLSDGSTDYVNVRLFAYTNFNNRDLSLPTTASYTYRIFALV